jgi:hypothetical protein
MQPFLGKNSCLLKGVHCLFTVGMLIKGAQLFSGEVV